MAKPPASRRRPPAAPAAAQPEDDRFAPHPGQTIDTVYVISTAFELVFARPRVVGAVMLASVVLSAAISFLFVTVGVLHNPLWVAAGIDEVMDPASLLVL